MKPNKFTDISPFKKDKTISKQRLDRTDFVDLEIVKEKSDPKKVKTSKELKKKELKRRKSSTRTC